MAQHQSPVDAARHVYGDGNARWRFQLARRIAGQQTPTDETVNLDTASGTRRYIGAGTCGSCQDGSLDPRVQPMVAKLSSPESSLWVASW